MTEKQFQKRYVEKNNKVFDTWKNIHISRELDRYSLSHLISHLNGLGEIIDTNIEQGRYYLRKYNELKEENEQLKQLIKKVLETTPIEHNLALELKNSVRELYD